MELQDLSPSSKVWIYKSDRQMSSGEQFEIRAALNEFIPTWAAHGSSLFGAADIVKDWFVVLAVDESQVYASGCSIDSSVKFMRETGAKFNLDFFDRMHVLVEKNGEIQNIHFNEIGNYNDWKIYDPMTGSLEEYNANWLVNISESRFA
ncbi:MAG: hypothetical protein ACI837_000872 [Crocinitomicaceae bacterium]|jgi:hypothetical protein